MPTKIEWCDETINPVVGCSKCSPGCDNCYAERFAARLSANPKTSAKYAGLLDDNGHWTGSINFDLSVFDKLPKKRKSIFLASMGDVFHRSVPDEFIHQIFERIAAWPQHRFLFLTKRPYRADGWASYSNHDEPWPDNIWMGASIVDQSHAQHWIPLLLATPAAHRFISVEPMLSPIDLFRLDTTGAMREISTKNALTGYMWRQADHPKGGHLIKGEKLDWVICGPETGFAARPLMKEWVMDLYGQCQAAGTPFFFKGPAESPSNPFTDVSLKRERPW